MQEYNNISDIINSCPNIVDFPFDDQHKFFFQIIGSNNNKAKFNLVEFSINDEKKIKKLIDIVDFFDGVKLHLYIHIYSEKIIFNKKYFRLATISIIKNDVLNGEIFINFAPNQKFTFDNLHDEISGAFFAHLKIPNYKRKKLVSYDDYPNHNNIFPSLFKLLTHPEVIKLL